LSKTRISDLFKIGEWLPDQLDTLNIGANNINNVLCQDENYRPFKSFSESGSAVSSTGRVYNSYSFIDSGGTVHNFAATKSNLWKQSGSTWNSISRTSTGTPYATAVDGFWRFTEFGQRIIASNFADTPQSYIVGSSTAFANLSTSVPKMKNLTTLNNFVVGVNINDGTARPERVQWSALAGPTDFVPSPTTLAGFQDLSGAGGANQGIVTTQNYGVVVRERSLWRMEFIGSPSIWQFTQAEVNRGTLCLNSIISDGILVYYLDDNGFFAFDGTKSFPIGDKKIDRYFFARLDGDYLDRIKAAVDPVNKFIVWAYPTNGSQGKLTSLIMYFWAEGRWSQADESLDTIATMYTSGLTLEQLSAIYPSIETVPFSLDSRVWAGGNRTLGGFSTSHKIGFFEGLNKAATLETSEIALNPGGRSFVSSILPVTDSTGVYARIKSRKNQYGSVTTSSSATFSSQTNEIPFRVDDRYHRVELTISAGSTWEQIQGIQFRAKPTGNV
jgi:hypothetical protein